MLSKLWSIVKKSENKNWETDFYQINYYSFEQSFKSETLKEYITNEAESDNSCIFRSKEKDPESLKMFIDSTLLSLKEIRVPHIVGKKAFQYNQMKKQDNFKSVISDITIYYNPNDVKKVNEFAEKCKVIKGRFCNSFLGHLESKKNPICSILEQFEKNFWDYYMQYLCIKEENLDDPCESASQEMENATILAKRDVKNMIYLTCITIVAMYKLNLSQKSLDQDLLMNTVTSHILQSNIYFVLYNMIAKNQASSLSQIQSKMETLKNLRPQHLDVSDTLSLDSSLREHLIGSWKEEELKKQIKQPYHQTIERLQVITQLEWCLTKLDVLFKIFTGILCDELKDFWKGNQYLSKKDLYIDASSLRSLMVYILVQVNNSKLKVDLDLIQEFMPPVLEFTNRAYYVALMQSAFEFIDSLTDDKITELLNKSTAQQSVLESQRCKSFMSKSYLLKFRSQKYEK